MTTHIHQTSLSGQQQQTRSLLLLSGVIDLFLSLMKVVIGWFSNSHALIADGIHSFSDLLTDVMVWILNGLGMEAPDDEHPYGHARFETFGALILGVILIVVAGLLIWDSVLRLIDIESVKTPTWPALIAALISIAAKEWLYQVTRLQGERFHSNLLIANAWHHRSDALSSVIVLTGVAGAMFGITWLEMAAAIGVALMIALVGWKLLRESVEELVDTALSESYVKDIQKSIEVADGVIGVHSLRTRRMGSAVILDIHLQVDPSISVSEGHHIGDWVTSELKQKFSEIADVTVHIDAEDDAESPPTSILPLRSEVKTILLDLWKDDLDEQCIEKMTLHYLDNTIDVEVYLKQMSIPEGGRLQQRLNDKAKCLDWFGEALVWVGCDRS